MARTLTELIAIVRQRSDTEGSTFVSDSEITSHLNDAIRELQDVILSAWGVDASATKTTLTTTANQLTVALPTDFARLIRLHYEVNGLSVPLRRFQITNDPMDTTPRAWDQYTEIRYSLAILGTSVLSLQPVPNAAYTLTMYYITKPSTLVNSSDTLNMPYDDYVTTDAAIKVLQKEESDVSVFVAQKEVIRSRIMADGTPPDMGQASSIVDARGYEDPAWLYQWRMWR